MNLFNRYKESAISTADNVGQLIFILDEIIKMLHLSKKSLQEHDYDTKYRYLIKVVDIFYILKSGLNTSSGGPLINILDNFYATAAFQLEKINILSSNSEDISPIIKAVTEIRNSLSEASQQQAE